MILCPSGTGGLGSEERHIFGLKAYVGDFYRSRIVKHCRVSADGFRHQHACCLSIPSFRSFA